MKVTIIVPCYNVERYIADCLKSIENQTHSDLEIICVDDGSTDRTRAILRALIAASPKDIKLLEQQNKGASSARNHALQHSSGAYIQFLDADDLLEPEKITHQVALAQAADWPAIVVGSYSRVDMRGTVMEKRAYSASEKPNLWLHLMKTDMGITSSNLFKADLFTEGILWNEAAQSSQEYDLMFQVLKKTRHLLFDPEIYTHIRVRKSGSISQTNLAAKWERYVQLRADILSYISATEPGALSSELVQIMFDAIRMLYPYNPESSKAFYKTYIPKGFTPRPSAATGKGYMALYSIFGFETTEQIRYFLSKKKAQ